ncbi:MAG: hypothetical protein GWN01_12990 [Nitrosopumilaceae archaeon]|nr:hypothetical protein [Nitrosopumilaceae archaeon]NIU01779.1 hypothetical protein [Nitrosopumilaceae archaeon]NIV66502.1 hypothetical protein [Nitrosopumilaceae archaeon]NIX62381.1 hypothetical protein [Nitrosopumilaceae archaeon]
MTKHWLVWVGISFIIGGIVSLAMNTATQEPLSYLEGLSGYSVGWMIIGGVLIGYGYIRGKSKE